jgi:hypothetical protein
MSSDNRPNPRKGNESDIPPGPRKAAPSARPVVHRRATPPPPIVAYEDVTASCGHPEKFGLFEDRLDKFRRDRRKKVTDRPCRACRERKRLEEEEALKVRQAEKQQRAKEAAAAGPSPKKKPGADIPERLPDGAKFEVVYDAAQTRWTGTLTIADKVFTDSAGGVFKLLNRLDRQYRQSVPPASSPNPPDHGGK